MRENKERVQWALLENICVLRSVKRKSLWLGGWGLPGESKPGRHGFLGNSPAWYTRKALMPYAAAGPRIGYMKGQCVEYKPNYCAH